MEARRKTCPSHVRQAVASGGTQTSELVFGGFITAVSDTSETYDGSSWTATASLNTARSAKTGAGTYTAALMFASDQTANDELNESFN